MFSSTRDDATDLYTITPDGTGLTNITGDLPGSYFDPDWHDASRLRPVSTDTRIWSRWMPTAARGFCWTFRTASPCTRRGRRTGRASHTTRGCTPASPPVRPDATDQRFPANPYSNGSEPDWQPLHFPPTGSGYPRPKHASPLRVTLVPAFERCGTGDPPEFQHGPPFAYPSCHVRESSEVLRVGNMSSGHCGCRPGVASPAPSQTKPTWISRWT